jgi:hypothetical protein
MCHMINGLNHSHQVLNDGLNCLTANAIRRKMVEDMVALADYIPVWHIWLVYSGLYTKVSGVPGGSLDFET